MGIDTIHDGLSRQEAAACGLFSGEKSKKRAKGRFFRALLAIKPGQ
jgi:hypothetical protein